MKYLLIGLLLVSSLSLAQPFQSQKPLVCAEMDEVFKVIQEKYDEKPVLVSKDVKSDTQYVLMMNVKKDTWTMVQHNGEVACILGAGHQIKLMLENLGNGV